MPFSLLASSHSRRGRGSHLDCRLFKKVFLPSSSPQRTSQASFYSSGPFLGTWVSIGLFEPIWKSFHWPFNTLITSSLLTWRGRLAAAGWHRPEGQEPGGRNYSQCCVSCWATEMQQSHVNHQLWLQCGKCNQRVSNILWEHSLLVLGHINVSPLSSASIFISVRVRFSTRNSVGDVSVLLEQLKCSEMLPFIGSGKQSTKTGHFWFAELGP